MLAVPEQGSSGEGTLALRLYEGLSWSPSAPEDSLGCLSRGGGWGLPTLSHLHVSCAEQNPGSEGFQANRGCLQPMMVCM